MNIPLDELPAATLTLWHHLESVAVESDLRPRLLMEQGGEYAIQFVWRPNPTYEKYFSSYWWSSPEEAIRETIGILEDETMANVFKVGDLFQYLTAEMLPNDRDIVMTIARVEVKTLKNQRGEQTRIVVYFKETDKGMVVGNKTNVRQMAKLLGPETDNWVDKAIALYKTQVQAFGEKTMAIRVRDFLPEPKAAKGKAGKTHAAVPENAPTAKIDGNGGAFDDNGRWDTETAEAGELPTDIDGIPFEA